MTSTKAQTTAAITLLKELAQERVTLMAPAMQQVIAPAANAALQTVCAVLDEYFKEPESAPCTE